MNITDLILRGTAEEMPDPEFFGRTYYQTDPKKIFLDTGTEWLDVTPDGGTTTGGGTGAAVDVTYDNAVSLLAATDVQAAIDELTSEKVQTASNVGAQAEVFKAKTGVDLAFRTIKAGANVTVTQNANDIEIASSGGGGGGSSVSGEMAEILAETTLGAPAANVDWSGLAAGYDRYEIHAVVRTTAAAAIETFDLQYNGDTTSTNYYRSYSNGGSSTASAHADGFDAGVVNGGGALANTPSTIRIIVERPHDTTFHKNSSILTHARDAAASMWSSLRGQVWENTAAINRIVLKSSSGANWATGSWFRLVGYKTRNINYT